MKSQRQTDQSEAAFLAKMEGAWIRWKLREWRGASCSGGLEGEDQTGLGDWLAGGNGVGKGGAQCLGIWLGSPGEEHQGCLTMGTQDERQSGTTVCPARPRGQGWARSSGQETLGVDPPSFRDCHLLPLAQPTAPQTCPFVFVHKTVLELIVAEQVVHFLRRQKPKDMKSPGAEGSDPVPPPRGPAMKADQIASPSYK